LYRRFKCFCLAEKSPLYAQITVSSLEGYYDARAFPSLGWNAFDNAELTVNEYTGGAVKTARDSQKPVKNAIPVKYAGEDVGEFITDIVVEDSVILD
jgi:hypothetical protein